MNKVTIYSSDFCPYCTRAKRMCEDLKLAYEEINLSRNPQLRMQLSQQTGWRTVPMIFVGEKFIGGYDDMYRLHRQDELLKLIAAES